MKKGLLIAIEGVDGCGKTSLANNLYKYFKSLNKDILLTKEPGATPLGKYIKEYIVTNELDNYCEFLLFAADRAEHIKKIIKPALSNNQIIISDRFVDSSIVYQGFAGNVDLNFIEFINNFILGDIKQDLTIYINVDYYTAKDRILKREKNKNKFDKFDNAQFDFFQTIIDGFNNIFKNRDNILTIDGTLNEKEILDIAKSYLEEKFNI